MALWPPPQFERAPILGYRTSARQSCDTGWRSSWYRWALKFTAYESFAAAGFFLNSPLLSWIAPDIVSVRTFSGFIGIVEITLGLLIATRAFSPRLSALGSIGAIFLFLLTMTFVLSTPGVWQPGYGFPYPSPDPGQFLLKDLLLLGAAIWTAGEALGAARHASR